MGPGAGAVAALPSSSSTTSRRAPNVPTVGAVAALRGSPSDGRHVSYLSESANRKTLGGLGLVSMANPFVLRCAPFPLPPLPPATTRGFPICIQSRITAKSARLVTAVLTVFSQVRMVHFLNIHF